MLMAVAHALMISLTMAWEILWALILGFWLSGVIQAVVSNNARPPEAGPHGFIVEVRFAIAD